MTERTPELIDPADFDPMEEAFNFEAIRTELEDYVGALRALVHQREMEDDEGEDVENALDLSDEKVMTLLEDRSQFAADLKDSKKICKPIKNTISMPTDCKTDRKDDS